MQLKVVLGRSVGTSVASDPAYQYPQGHPLLPLVILSLLDSVPGLAPASILYPLVENISSPSFGSAAYNPFPGFAILNNSNEPVPFKVIKSTHRIGLGCNAMPGVLDYRWLKDPSNGVPIFNSISPRSGFYVSDDIASALSGQQLALEDDSFVQNASFSFVPGFTSQNGAGNADWNWIQTTRQSPSGNAGNIATQAVLRALGIDWKTIGLQQLVSNPFGLVSGAFFQTQWDIIIDDDYLANNNGTPLILIASNTTRRSVISYDSDTADEVLSYMPITAYAPDIAYPTHVYLAIPATSVSGSNYTMAFNPAPETVLVYDRVTSGNMSFVLTRQQGYFAVANANAPDFSYLPTRI